MPAIDDENELIRSYAYQLWQEEGQQEGVAQDNWLEAEARLRVRGQLPPKPVVFPYQFTLKIDKPVLLQHKSIICPFPDFSPSGNFSNNVTVSKNMMPINTRNPIWQSLPHDHRSVLIEVISASIVLDRIVRFTQFLADRAGYSVSDPYSVYCSIQNGFNIPIEKAIRSEISYLFDPQARDEDFPNISSAISNIIIPDFISFEVASISLGSPIKIAAYIVAAWAFLTPITTAIAESGKNVIVESATSVITTTITTDKERQSDFIKNWEKQALAEMIDGSHDKKIRMKQAILTDLGYSPGPIDGIFGTNTAREMKRFLDDHHMAHLDLQDKLAVLTLAHEGAEKLANTHSKIGNLIRILE